MEPRADDGDDLTGQVSGGEDLVAAMEPHADDGDDDPHRARDLPAGGGRNGAPC